MDRDNKNQARQWQLSWWKDWKPTAIKPRRQFTSVPSNLPTGQEQNADLTAPFLRLPFELREPILYDILGGGIIHLIQYPKKLRHVRCKNYSDEKVPDDLKQEYVLERDFRRKCFSERGIPSYHFDAKEKLPDSTDNCLALLLTCVQLYYEAANILYKNNTFDVHHPSALISLYQTLAPNHFETIQSLQISWWDHRTWTEKDRSTRYKYSKTAAFLHAQEMCAWNEMWRIIGKHMTSLKTLNLMLEAPAGSAVDRFFHDYPEKILQPVTAYVSGIQNFTLCMDYDLDKTNELQNETSAFVCQPRIEDEKAYFASLVFMPLDEMSKSIKE
ncbi:hypothetical protein BGZ60DRAFT_415519 [Tricladium varicosporioides]|nr:hypothetical protein BGZ60DRAFT_415519 [Hymenoscyphus varicosporioides]